MTHPSGGFDYRSKHNDWPPHGDKSSSSGRSLSPHQPHIILSYGVPRQAPGHLVDARFGLLLPRRSWTRAKGNYSIGNPLGRDRHVDLLAGHTAHKQLIEPARPRPDDRPARHRCQHADTALRVEILIGQHKGIDLGDYPRQRLVREEARPDVERLGLLGDSGEALIPIALLLLERFSSQD